MVDQKKLKKGRIAEDLVSALLKLEEYYVDRYSLYDENGNELAQIISIQDQSYICPDLEVYHDSSRTMFLMRVEVKSLSSLYTKYKLKGKYLTVKKYQFDSYYRLQRDEEVECRIVFVVGDNLPMEYDIYWARLNDLENSEFLVLDAYGDGEDYLFDISVFNRGIDEYFLPF